MQEINFKSGYVAIIGKPNVGKSTLINSILQQKLSIVSRKPQTTRKKVLGIYNEKKVQIVFIDTPGILEPHYLLQKKMGDYIISSMQETDVLLFIVDTNNYDILRLGINEKISSFLQKSKIPKIVAINKIDLLKTKSEVLQSIDCLSKSGVFNEIIPISALESENIPDLLQSIIKYLPEHIPYFDEESITNAPVRFFVTEIIREKIFEKYHDEIPYSVEVVIDEYNEREKGKDYISVSILVEKGSQKGIIIGKGGDALKRIGELARKEIEKFVGKEVYLKTFVKVREDWRNNEMMLKNLGY